MNTKHKHFRVVTENLDWAIGLAGAVMQAQSVTHKDANPGITLSFETKNPAIRYMGHHFGPSSAEPEVLLQPTDPEEISKLEVVAHRLSCRELEDRYGVKAQISLQPLGKAGLARAVLINDHLIICKENYWYPEFSKKALSRLDNCDGVTTMTKSIPFLEAWLKGNGVDNPVVKDLTGVDPLTRLLYMDSPKVRLVGTHYTDPEMYFLRARYTNYDNIGNHKAILSFQDGAEKVDARKVLTWASVLPAFLDESLDDMQEKGAVWALRAKYNFSHIDWIKDTFPITETEEKDVSIR